MRSLFIALICHVLGVFVAIPEPVYAETQAHATATGTANVPVEQLKRLKATLEDEDKRSALVADIETLIALGTRPGGDGDEGGGKLGREMVKALSELNETLANVPPILSQLRADAEQVMHWAIQTWRDPGMRSNAALQIASFAGILGVGWLAEYGFWVAASPIRRRLMTRAPPEFLARCRYGMQRAAIELLPIIAFFTAAAAFGVIGGSASKLTAAGLVLAFLYGSVRTLLVFGRLMLAPQAAGLRLLPLTTPTSIEFYRLLRRIVLVVAIAAVVVLWSRLAGLPSAGERLITNIAVLCGSAVLVTSILLQRSRWQDWVLGRLRQNENESRPQWLLEAALRSVPIFVLAFIVGLTAVILLRIDGGVAFVLRGFSGSALTLMLAWLAVVGLRQLLGKARSLTVTERHPSPWRFATPFLHALHWLGRAVVLVLAVLSVLESWGAGTLGWLSSPSGQRWIGSAASIVLLVGGAVILWHLFNAAITRRLEYLESEGSAVPRARTLLPLVRRAVFIMLAFLVGMLMLSEVGVAVAPLLAGAGIVGLAVGFGAQKLIQDVITGIFILLENAVAIGDVVTVAGTGGLVEDLSIRSIRLRDLSGNVHTIPFSSVDTITNMTRDYSYYLLDIGVAYREDTDAVAEICREIVGEMRADPEFGPFILEPLEVLGVDQFTDSAVIIKARIKTTPIKQWLVGREFNRRMKKRFDELGIEFPFSHGTIYFGVDKQGVAPSASVRIDRGARRDGRAEGKPTSETVELRSGATANPDADRER